MEGGDRFGRLGGAVDLPLPHSHTSLRETPYADLRAQGRTPNSIHTPAPQCGGHPVEPAGFGGWGTDNAEERTRRIKAGRSRPSSTIVSSGSLSELSRYGARHVGRLGEADLDTSGRLVSEW